MSRAVFEALDARLLFATFNVTTTTDGGAGSLRQAIIDANALPGTDTITVPVGTYTLALAGANEDAGATGDLDITDDVTINGAALATTVIQAGTTTDNGIDRVFDVHALADVTFNDLTITNGRVTGGDGGGIRNTGALTLDTVAVTFNHAIPDTLEGGDGGGIFTESEGLGTISGTTTIRDSFVSDNLADNDGGGVYHVPEDGDLVIENTEIDRNDATDGDAGGLYHVPGRGDLTVTGSQFSQNSAAGDAGGIYSVAFEGSFSLTDSTVTENTSAEGGGIYHVPRTGDLTITDSTVSLNQSTGDAAGIYFVPATGDLTMLRAAVTLNGAGGNGGGIYITPGEGIARLTNTTVMSNSAGLEGGGINTDAGGLVLLNCTVSVNAALGGDGGGIEAEDTLSISACTVSNNTATGDGGGVNVSDAVGSFFITASTLNQNTADGRGGAIRTSTSFIITDSTISNNSATQGGGLWAKEGQSILLDSTFSGNQAVTDGGGMFLRNLLDLSAPTLIQHITITDNRAVNGGGIFLDSAVAPRIVNTIVAENLFQDSPTGGAGPDLNGAFESGGSNLIGIIDGATGFTDGVDGDLVGTANDPLDPVLGPLENNGGNGTFTHALLTGSPAIDAGDETESGPEDQRGFARPQGPAPDIGAFEGVEVIDPPPVAIFSIDDVAKDEGDSGLTSFVFTVTRAENTTGTETIAWSTEYGNSITSVHDMDEQSGTVTFEPGDLTKTITVFVKGDTQVEQDNLFFVNLTPLTSNTVLDQGRGDILNDDVDQPPPQEKGSIAGHVFNDRNVNLIRDGGEPVLQGFTIYLDRNNNGRRDSGEPRTTSNSAGDYRFSNLSAGNYIVRIEPKDGFRQSKPQHNAPHVVTLGAGQDLSDRGFGMTRRASISGTVYRDGDSDGKLDGNEQGLSGRRVFIDTDGDGKLDGNEQVVTTNSQGRYVFNSVAPGFVRLRLLLEGSTPTVGSDGVWHLNVKDGQILTNKHFGLR